MGTLGTCPGPAGLCVKLILSAGPAGQPSHPSTPPDVCPAPLSRGAAVRPVVKHDPSRVARYSTRFLRGQLQRRPAPPGRFPSHVETFGSPTGGSPGVFGGYDVAPPDANVVRLFDLYRTVSSHNDHEAELRAVETHRFISR